MVKKILYTYVYHIVYYLRKCEALHEISDFVHEMLCTIIVTLVTLPTPSVGGIAKLEELAKGKPAYFAKLEELATKQNQHTLQNIEWLPVDICATLPCTYLDYGAHKFIQFQAELARECRARIGTFNEREGNFIRKFFIRYCQFNRSSSHG